jgi:RNA polymerase sigma-70 factor (ECF subfamily)
MLKVTFHLAYPLAMRAAQVRATAAVLSGAVLLADREDIEQEALIACWRALHKFDPRRASLRTFVERIVANQITSAIRRLRAEKRQAHRDVCAPTHVDCKVDSLNLRMDVQRVLEGLGPDQRDVCRMLADHSATDVSRRAGISRATIYRMIGHLRLIFIEAGLHKSLRRGAGC